MKRVPAVVIVAVWLWAAFETRSLASWIWKIVSYKAIFEDQRKEKTWAESETVGRWAKGNRWAIRKIVKRWAEN